MDESYTIGTVAELVGVGIETIRFYERRGLLETPPRNSSGYRIYTPDVVSRIRFIRNARELGFSLTEVQTLLLGYGKRAGSCSAVKSLLESKVREIDEKLGQIRLAKDKLEQLIADCPADGKCDECTILQPVIEAGIGDE